MPTLIGRRIAQINPDVINLHWVSDGFVPIHAIQQFKKPIVWSLHDQWPLTGGCHYDQECGRYQRRCGDCPLLGSKSRYDISYLTLLAKRLFWRNADITIVALSNWLAECARKSSLFYDRRIEIIPNGVDLSRFKPISKDIARNILDLPPQKKLILFGAMNSAKDRRKGFHLLQPALQQLAVQGTERNAEAVIFGARQPDHVPDVGMHIHYTGQLHDEVSLALLYAAADVFVAPSLQDNLPNTVMEALACGTPCVGFNIGGIPDMIEHQQNGYLAQPFETDDLARGIAWVLEDEERHRRLSQRAREKVVQEFSIERQARAYLKLYEEVVGQ
jgi:glycosyltransferase involved in cell wall biosynthesis